MRKMKEHESDKSDNSQWRKRIHFIGAVLLAVKILIVAAILSGCTEDVIDKSGEYLAAAGVEGIFPANFAESVEVNPIIGIVFKTRADPATLAASSLTLNDGSSDIPGKVITSGKTALFTYDEDLKPMTRYVATFVMAVGSSKGEDDSFKYSWNFRTGKEHRDNSISVVSVSPVNNSKNVAVGTNITVNLSR